MTSTAPAGTNPHCHIIVGGSVVRPPRRTSRHQARESNVLGKARPKIAVPRLSKSDLLTHVESGFRAGGWSVLYLSAPGEHPARYRIRGSDDVAFIVRVYIWNVTHGGGPRSAAEYRIQITGLQENRFVPEVGGMTLILGWWDNEEVFAGFDYRKHSGPFGGSPSFQIGMAALQAAVTNRFAVHEKGNGELAIAFRPDFIGTYAENLDALHDAGQVANEIDLLSRIAEEPADVSDTEIEQQVAAPRRWAVVETRRALRALDFSERVLNAYSNRCAVCGIQLRLLDGAHILPVSEPGSTDETANGVALCALHHRAYDRSLITFDTEYRIHLNQDRIDELRTHGLHRGIKDFRRRLRDIIAVPTEKANRPRAELVDRANELRGWDL